MTPHERLTRALQAAEPGHALRALVLELSKEGYTKANIHRFLEEFLIAFRTQKDHRESDEDLLLDLMDALTGCCHPNAQLLPDNQA